MCVAGWRLGVENKSDPVQWFVLWVCQRRPSAEAAAAAATDDDAGN